jgi:hypothetical protein
VFGERFAAGVNLAVESRYTTVPETDVVPCIKVKFVVVIDEGSIPALNVAEILLLIAVLVALFIGVVEVTLGRMGGFSVFLHPTIRTIISIAMIDNIFFSFIFIWF